MAMSMVVDFVEEKRASSAYISNRLN